MLGKIFKILFGIALASFALSCPSTDKLCLQCRDTRCALCAHSFPGSNGICTRPTKQIKGCFTYSSNNVCSRCQEGYYFNPLSVTADTTCVRLADSIKNVCHYSTFSDKKCTHCRNSVLQSGGGCTPLTFCSDPKCDSCYIDKATGLQMCYKCVEGFTKFAGVFPPVCVETPEIQFCDSFLIPKVCDVCRPGYYYKSGKCEWNKSTTFKAASLLKIFVMVKLALLFRI